MLISYFLKCDDIWKFIQQDLQQWFHLGKKPDWALCKVTVNWSWTISNVLFLIYLFKKFKSSRILFIIFCKSVCIPNIVCHDTDWTCTVHSAGLAVWGQQHIWWNPCLSAPRFFYLLFSFTVSIFRIQGDIKAVNLHDSHISMGIYMMCTHRICRYSKIVNAGISSTAPLKRKCVEFSKVESLQCARVIDYVRNLLIVCEIQSL